MDPLTNPYAPGAGAPPPELAGRDDEMAAFKLLIGRLSAGRPQQSLLLTGLRGVGKTVLLNRFQEIGSDAGWAISFKQVPGERDKQEPFREIIAEQSRRVLYELARDGAVRAIARKAMGVLRSFRPTMSLNPVTGAPEWSVGVEPVAGVADSGMLGDDLADLFLELGALAQAKGVGVLYLLDEVQYLRSADLSALIMAVHRATQRNLPITIVAAGLPQLPTLAAEAKTYAERLFDFRSVGALDSQAARRALVAPAAEWGVEYEEKALDLILRESDGYAYFLQEWGQKAWNLAPGPKITLDDAGAAQAAVTAELDAGFFRIRYDRATERERQYLQAMAELGDGPCQSSSVAAKLGLESPSRVSVFRDNLIRKGLIWSPDRGLLRFSVPHFADFLRRNPVS